MVAACLETMQTSQPHQKQKDTGFGRKSLTPFMFWVFFLHLSVRSPHAGVPLGFHGDTDRPSRGCIASFERACPFRLNACFEMQFSRRPHSVCVGNWPSTRLCWTQSRNRGSMWQQYGVRQSNIEHRNHSAQPQSRVQKVKYSGPPKL